MRIGDCTLETRLGAGGMGEVWRATHASSGRAVAVKLIKSADQTSADQLLAEAAAMARLDHPGIAWVYEFGTLDAPCGTLPAGTPWMALELATGGSLADIREGLAWSDLRDVLLDLLDALAHAHAHGLIHRDLKPANVLVCSTDDPRPGLKIADFGIARLRWDQREPLWAGTPVFMAPEQVRGEWRRFGPWTDVYGLGAIAWWLVTGAHAFRRDGRAATLRAQLHEAPRGFLPRHAVPEGLEAWLRTALAKAPGERFRSAADAAEALRGLVGPLRGGTPGPSAHPPPRTRGNPLPYALSGMGCTLLGIREPRLVGRREQVEALEALLEEAATTRSPRVAWLRGPAGSGRTRLARWILERARTSGRGDGLFVEAHEGEGALVDAWRRELSAEGLQDSELEQHLLEQLEDLGVGDLRLAAALAQVLAGRTESREGVLTRLVALRCIERPQIIVVDDIDLAMPLSRWVGTLLGGVRLPLLVLVTTADERLHQRPEVGEQLAAMVGTARMGRRLDLEPLEPEVMARLVYSLVGLAPRAVAVLTQTCRGNPGRALEHLTSWAAQDRLVPGPGGLELDGGADAEGPVKWAWGARLARLEEDLPQRVGADLERAAIWRGPLSWEVWDQLSETPRAARAFLLERLVIAGLARSVPGGLVLTSQALLNALNLRSRQWGRLEDHHQRCAAVYERRLGAAGSGDFRSELECARHLWRAGDPRAPDLLIALLDHDGDDISIGDWLILNHECTVALGDPDDPRYPRVLAFYAALQHQIGDARGALENADRAAGLARRVGDRHSEALALKTWALAKRDEDHDLVAYRAALEQAAALVEPYSSSHGRIAYDLAAAAYSRKDVPEMARQVEIVNRVLPSLGPALENDALRMNGYLADRRGDRAGARHHLTVALEHAQVHGRIAGAGYIQSYLAGMDVADGAIDAAIRRYQEATELASLAGHGVATDFALQLTMLQTIAGRTAEALTTFEEMPSRTLSGITERSRQIVLLVLGVADRDWPRVESALDSISPLPDFGYADEADAAFAWAASRCRDQHRPSIADRLDRLRSVH